MENFVAIASGLNVAPALAELAEHSYFWISPNANALLEIPLLSANFARELANELPEVWHLIDTALERARAHGDPGRLAYCRVGLIPPGAGIPPHYDGIDGIAVRRYQLALAAEPGVVLVIDGEAKCPRPGELWQIDVSKTHHVTNGSGSDRITILFDTKV